MLFLVSYCNLKSLPNGLEDNKGLFSALCNHIMLKGSSDITIEHKSRKESNPTFSVYK